MPLYWWPFLELHACWKQAVVERTTQHRCTYPSTGCKWEESSENLTTLEDEKKYIFFKAHSEMTETISLYLCPWNPV